MSRIFSIISVVSLHHNQPAVQVITAPDRSEFLGINPANLIAIGSIFFNRRMEQLSALAARHALPAIANLSESPHGNPPRAVGIEQDLELLIELSEETFQV